MPVAGSDRVSANPAVAAAVSAVPDPTAAADGSAPLGWIRRRRWWIWRQERFNPHWRRPRRSMLDSKLQPGWL